MVRVKGSGFRVRVRGRRKGREGVKANYMTRNLSEVISKASGVLFMTIVYGRVRVRVSKG